MPSEVGRWSVNPRVTSWQVAHDTLPSAESRTSKYSFRPSATRSAVRTLSAGCAASKTT
ncbi:MAG: hypothetical protein AB7Q15_09215 [Vicinamibacterales bacterium]